MRSTDVKVNIPPPPATHGVDNKAAIALLTGALFLGGCGRETFLSPTAENPPVWHNIAPHSQLNANRVPKTNIGANNSVYYAYGAANSERGITLSIECGPDITDPTLELDIIGQDSNREPLSRYRIAEFPLLHAQDGNQAHLAVELQEFFVSNGIQNLNLPGIYSVKVNTSNGASNEQVIVGMGRQPQGKSDPFVFSFENSSFMFDLGPLPPYQEGRFSSVTVLVANKVEGPDGRISYPNACFTTVPIQPGQTFGLIDANELPAGFRHGSSNTKVVATAFLNSAAVGEGALPFATEPIEIPIKR